MQLLLSTLLSAIPLLSAAMPINDLARRGFQDQTLLQFALTLEHTENAFYAQALQQFDDQAFADAGFEPFVLGRIKQLFEHENSHVKFLEGVLGDAAPQACTYKFPFNDVKTFTALSATFEGVGTSAYLGASGLFTDPTFATQASQILTTEARHQSFMAGPVLKVNPWSGSFDTPLDTRQVISIASQFIVSCPSSNPPLPASPFPALNVTTTNPTPGQTINISFEDSNPGGARFLAFLSGQNKFFAPISGPASGATVTLPSNLQGTVYALVTSDQNTVTDDNTIAGVAIMLFPFDSKVDNSQ